MPELPEVETIARGLHGIVGQRIEGVEVRWQRTIDSPAPSAFAQRLRGQRITAVGRRGKWLRLYLENGDHLLIHLRMTGRLILEPADAPLDRYTRVLLTLEGGQRLRFSDQRKFGRMILTDEPDEVLGDLGPEPLEEDFTAEKLAQMLAQRRGRLKPLLLNQRFLVGLGNIYVNEALWRARIHPLRPANTLSAEEVERLHHAIQEVLRQAIAQRGTTLDDGGYVGADQETGDFAPRLAVYGREGETCPRCGSTIVRLVVGQRGTHVCPCCQPEEGSES